MEGDKKCFGLLLALFITVGLSLSVCSDTNALLHQYDGINLITPNIPDKYKNVDGKMEIDWDYNYSSSLDFARPYGLHVASGDNTTQDFSNYRIVKPNIYLISESDNGLNPCQYVNYYKIISYYMNDSNLNRFAFSSDTANFSYFPDSITGFSRDLTSYCRHNLKFGISPQPAFNNGSLPFTDMIIRNAVRNDMNDYWFTSNGFYINSSAINESNGITYTHSFSFKDMFNGEPLLSMSYFELPLYSKNDYWRDSSNFYNGREVKWRGTFHFDGNVQFDDFSDFKVRLFGSDGYNTYNNDFLNCSVRITGVQAQSQTVLNYECSGNLPRDYVWLYPSLIMDAENDWFFYTDSDWRFGTQFLITDNDETPGESFNSTLEGGYIFGDAKNDFSDGEQNWYQSLLNLFRFNVIFPMTSLYTMFSDKPCVDIPILASMLHSEQTTYCAWFDSTTRSIVTPVMSIASTMIIFGFFVRWLKGHSSDVISFEGDTTNG